MITSQEIIERSIYQAILERLKSEGLTLDPSDYLPVTQSTIAQFKSDREAIIKAKGLFISLFGTGNSQSRGEKTTPRIVVDMGGFFPGEMGLGEKVIEKEDDDFVISETPFEAIDQIIDVRLVYNNVSDGRLLHKVLHSSIPQRGYLKPYNLESKPFDGNIFIYVSNYFSSDDVDKGINEDVYQFMIKDTLINDLETIDVVPPLTDISILIENIELSINP